MLSLVWFLEIQFRFLFAISAVAKVVHGRVFAAATESMLDTAVLGGLEPSVADLSAMHRDRYVLHVAGEKLTKVPAQKSRLPHDPKGSIQMVHTTLGPNGTANHVVISHHVPCPEKLRVRKQPPSDPVQVTLPERQRRAVVRPGPC